MTSIATMNATNHIDESTLPQGWVWSTLGDTTQPVVKADPKTEPDVQFTYLDISSIDNSRNIITEPKFYVGRDAPSRARQLVFANDVLFSTVRTYLKNIALVPEQYDGQIASTGFSVLRGEAGVSGEYLFYLTLSHEFLEKLGRLQRGVSYPAVRDQDVRAQPIPLAPTAEQHRIVAEIEAQFTRLDAGIAALKRAQANLRRYKASVLKAACEGRLVPTGAELTAVGADGVRPPYEPASALLERILTERRAKWEETQWAKEVDRAKQKAAKAKRRAAGRSLRRGERLSPQEWQDTPEAEYARHLPKDDKWKAKYKEPAAPDTDGLPELPEGWAWATVEQLAAHEPNSITDGPFGSKLKTVHYREDGPRVIRLQNVGNGEFHDEEAHIGWEHFETLRKHEVFAGDLVIAALGASLPRSCVIPGHVGPAIVKADCIRFKPCAAADVTYLNAALNSEPLKRYAAGIIHGVGRPRLNRQEIKSLPIPLPPLVEQRRIGDEAERQRSVLKELEATVEANLKRAERLRQAILKRAFEGKLVPQDPNDEPASVLLEKIRQQRGTVDGTGSTPKQQRSRGNCDDLR